jgi:dihydroflavonol-4-reductase
MKVILDFVNGAQTTYEGGLNYVHVYDVAEAHAAALEKGVPGERYIVGGDNLHLKELADLIEKIAGVRPRHMGITGPLAELTGALMGAASKLTGSTPPYDRALVRDVVGRYGYYDCGQTHEALGLAPLGADQVVRDAIRWLLFIGKIKPAVAERISDALPPDGAW